MITALAAAKAYAATQQSSSLTDKAALAAGPEAAGGSFGDILKNVMGDTIQSTKAAESQMSAGLQGKADLVNVVTAVSSAEASLETMMAVRDQVISAYQEIMRMPI
jgi:flagellar hook-basal body complex protein FliE